MDLALKQAEQAAQGKRGAGRSRGRPRRESLGAGAQPSDSSPGPDGACRSAGAASRRASHGELPSGGRNALCYNRTLCDVRRSPAPGACPAGRLRRARPQGRGSRFGPESAGALGAESSPGNRFRRSADGSGGAIEKVLPLGQEKETITTFISNSHGEVREWLKRAVSKTASRVSGTRVRIPPSPFLFSRYLFSVPLQPTASFRIL